MPRIVIHSPDYTHLHSGVRCLHLLCDRLSRLGFRAAVTSGVVDPRSQTLQVDPARISANPSILDHSIVIYPEIVSGNPLGARNVVRYLLNRPGVINRRIGIACYGSNDYFLHFAEEFRPAGLQSRQLRLPLVDTSVFTPPSTSAERDGFLLYSRRYRPDIGGFPDWIHNLTTITRAAPRDPPTLAELYRASRALIVGERTLAIAEALHCHCPVILLPHARFEYEPLVAFFGGHGLAVGFDQGALSRAMESAAVFPAHYAAQSADIDECIVEFVADAARYFGLRSLQKAAASPRARKNWRRAASLISANPG